MRCFTPVTRHQHVEKEQQPPQLPVRCRQLSNQPHAETKMGPQLAAATPEMMHCENRAIAAPQAASAFMSFTLPLCLCARELYILLICCAMHTHLSTLATRAADHFLFLFRWLLAPLYFARTLLAVNVLNCLPPCSVSPSTGLSHCLLLCRSLFFLYLHKYCNCFFTFFHALQTIFSPGDFLHLLSLPCQHRGAADSPGGGAIFTQI